VGLVEGVKPVLEALVCEATCVAELAELEVTAAAPWAELGVVGLSAVGWAPA